MLAKLRAGVSHDLRPGVRCVDSERPFSFNAGPGRGEIFLSSALVDALPPDQLEIVVEHERAHGRRRDGLRRLLAQALSWPHRPALRRELLEELDLATERACDEAAARRLGDRLGVAEAILAVEKLAGAAPGATPIPFPAFGGSSVPARVQALLGDPGDEAAVQVRWWVGAVVVASGLLTYPIHHLTEHALGLLFGAP